ncbi:hypothetical protein ACLB2K_048545 [Fragaria x ananassa]
MSSRYKKQLTKLEELIKDIKKGVSGLMNREFVYEPQRYKENKKEKDLREYIVNLYDELKAIKVGKSNSFTNLSSIVEYLDEARNWLCDELELVEAQNKALDVAIGTNNFKAIREQLQRIKAGESKDSSSTYNLTKAIGYIDKPNGTSGNDLVGEFEIIVAEVAGCSKIRTTCKNRQQ